MRRDSLLVIDRSNGVVHRKDCPALLTATVHLEPYVGLEHAIASGLRLCPCVHVIVMRETSAFLHRASSELGIPSVERVCASLDRLVTAFEESLHPGVAAGPHETNH